MAFFIFFVDCFPSFITRPAAGMAEPNSNSTTSGSTTVTEETNKDTPVTKPATESDATAPASSAPNVEEPTKEDADVKETENTPSDAPQEKLGGQKRTLDAEEEDEDAKKKRRKGKHLIGIYYLCRHFLIFIIHG